MTDDYDDGMGPVIDRVVVEYDGERYVAEMLGPSDWSPDDDPGSTPPEDVAAWERGDWVSVFLRVTAEREPHGYDTIGAMLGKVPSDGTEHTFASIIADKLRSLVDSSGLDPRTDGLEVAVVRHRSETTQATVLVSKAAMRAHGFKPERLDPRTPGGVADWIRETGADAEADYKTVESEDSICEVRPVS